MLLDLGIVQPGTTIYIPFHTFDSNDPSASVTLTGLATTDIEVYKNGSTTQRASDSGFALLDTDGIDFDAITGIHGFSINLADNSDAGFYASGAQYWVVVSSVTVDAATINFVAATFRIGYPGARLNTTIATLSTQTSFTLTDGPAEDDALNGCWCIIHDVASAVQCGHAIISDYTGSTKTVTLAAGTTFTAAASDHIAIMGPAPLQPATAGRTAAVGTSGQVDANVTQAGGTAWGSGAITAASIAADAITAAKVADGAIDAATFAAGAITAASIAASALNGKGDWNIGKTGYALSAAGVDAIWDEPLAAHTTADTPGQVLNMLTQDAVTLSTDVALDSILGQLLDNGTAWSYDRTTDSLEAIADSGGGGPTAAQIADAVWDEAQADHVAVGSFGITASEIADILVDTAEIGAAGAGLTNINLPNQTMDITGNITGNLSGSVGSVAAGGITASSIATGAIDADALALDAVNEIADGVLDRNMATGTDSGAPTVRTVRQSLRASRNKVDIVGGTATVYKEDDITASWTAAVTTTAGNPISTIDPASA